MAQQPVNFEQERQRILAEIEARAKERGGELTLQDWLKAAEEVMPDSATAANLQGNVGNERILGTADVGEERVSLSASARPKRRNRTRTRPTRKQADRPDSESVPPVAANERHDEEGGEGMGARNAIWVGVIGTIVLAAVLGAGGLAFYKLHNEIKTLSTRLDQMEARLSKLERAKAPVEKATLDAITARLDALEKKALPVDAQQQVSDQVHSELTDANVVTEAVLDAKLEQFSQRIEQVIDKRFATLLVQLKSLRATASTPASQPTQSEPVSDAPKKDADQTLSVTPPAQPAEPRAPEVKPPLSEKKEAGGSALSENEQWLAQQPANNWTLQLASVLDKASLDHMIRTKKLNEAKIVRQIRDGQTRYVLIQGSFSDRASAREAATAVRTRTGISPWVRHFRPLQANLPH